MIWKWMAALALMGPLLAQTPAVKQKQPCQADARLRQFDFWLGTWDVRVNGKSIASSRIESVLDGCLVQENWMPFQGREGKSWNYFNPVLGQWEQLWMSAGNVLKLVGTLREGVMVLEGKPEDPANVAVRDRITYTPLPDGTVRQVWTQSKDEGKTWKTLFDGIYVRKP